MNPATARKNKRSVNLILVAAICIGGALLFSVYSGLRSVGIAQKSSTALNIQGLAAKEYAADVRTLGEIKITAQTIIIQGEIQQQSASQSTAVEKLSPPPLANSLVSTSRDEVSNMQKQKYNIRKYHLVTTAQGFPNHWQARIHYFWYMKQKSLCEVNEVCDMGGFTRLLHSGEADDLMDEIPTVVVLPLPKDVMGNSSYVVLNRPFAFMEWLKVVSIPERYILMGESDHIILRPMPNLMINEDPAAYLFSYMVPKEYPSVVRKFLGNLTDAEVEALPRIGNSPTFISTKDMRLLAPVWFNTTLDIFNDAEAHAAWNWVLEMYGFLLSTHKMHLNVRQYVHMMAQPPWDSKSVVDGDSVYLLHFTYPMMFAANGSMTFNKNESVWSFEKRVWSDHPPERDLKEPPPNVEHELVRTLIRSINEATSSIPCWDNYVVTHKAGCGV